MRVCLWRVRIALVGVVLAGMYWANQPVAGAVALTKEPGVYGTYTPEVTPLLYQGRQLLFQSHRAFAAGQDAETYLALRDLDTGQELSRFGDGYQLGSAYVSGNQINVYATLGSIYRFTSTDAIHWSAPTLAVAPSSGEALFNSSVTQDSQGYVMAYETTKPLQFAVKFARSTDLANWQKLDIPAFAGRTGNEYSACPTIRYSGSYYYMIYLHAPIPNHNGWIPYIARSKDLTTWQISDKNPILEAGVGTPPGVDEGINNSDVDLVEVNGKTYLYYLTGDQATWGDTRRAVYDGTMSNFLSSYFPTETPEPGTWALLVMGLAGLLCSSRARRKMLRMVPFRGIFAGLRNGCVLSKLLSGGSQVN